MSSLSCKSSGNSHRRPLMCDYGERPVLNVLGTKKNLGRMFWGCAYHVYEAREECQSFRRADLDLEDEEAANENIMLCCERRWRHLNLY
ncbi:hypothetical protein PIB30_094154 [Stylosanthes scabra]|uniref:Zinc finger GRF-type domain-containing protein n=1 Tax=Stylosanthes scabra TaxID=79078 RepID=A0ABU6SVX5_9FABA|nr:hypothetical protein [Stylosanthes scabra]